MSDPTKGPLQYEPKFTFDEDAKSFLMKGPSLSTVAHDMQLAFSRDVEGKMRAALIAMGWAPPEIAQRHVSALRMIAGREQCVDSLMGNVDIAIAALDGGRNG